MYSFESYLYVLAHENSKGFMVYCFLKNIAKIQWRFIQWSCTTANEVLFGWSLAFIPAYCI